MCISSAEQPRGWHLVSGTVTHWSLWHDQAQGGRISVPLVVSLLAGVFSQLPSFGKKKNPSAHTQLLARRPYAVNR